MLTVNQEIALRKLKEAEERGPTSNEILQRTLNDFALLVANYRQAELLGRRTVKLAKQIDDFLVELGVAANE